VTRQALVASALGCLLLAALPASAAAHGIVGRRDLPIPQAAFFWASSGVLVVSFLLLGALWRRPLLQEPRERLVLRLTPWTVRVAEVALGTLGIVLFCVVVYAGLAGVDSPTANLAPTFVFVLFWVGLVPLTLVVGDVYRAVCPWRALARAIEWAGRRLSRGGAPAPLAYPDWLGYWPAVVGLAAFTWVELVFGKGDDPATLAVLALVYAAAQLVGISLFGVEAWIARGDAFSVYFGLFARLAPVAWSREGLWLRTPLAGVSQVPLAPGLVALLCVMIGSTAFDGGSEGPAWTSVAPDLQRRFTDLGATLSTGLELAFTVGLALAIVGVGIIYALGVAGMRAIVRDARPLELARAFAPTLVPIALAYVVAHYFSLLVYQGQAAGYLASDPLGDGGDIFGTATATVDYGVVSANGIWFVQVGALVVGHIAALVLAHDRALARWSDARRATLSQVWMLAVMVGFTVLGLWLLSTAGE
jgi:hypothetical protein